MAIKNKRKVFAIIINAVLFFILLLFHNSGISPIAIGGAIPFTALVLLITFSMFTTEWCASLTGLILGIFIDSIASTGSLFNTVMFFLAALITSFTVHYLFNNNVFSALALGAALVASYFIIKWIIFFVISPEIHDSMQYLLKTVLPSAIYTAVFIFPFYFLERKLFGYQKIGSNNISR